MDDRLAEGIMIGQNDSKGNSGFFGDSAWWIIILLIFGWFNNGNGFGGFGGNSGAADNYVLSSDFSQLSRQIDSGFASQERKLDSITNGLCDGFYTQAQLVNGVNQNISNGVYNLTSAITNSGYENRSAIGDVSNKISDCCCKTQRAIDGVNNNISTQIANLNYNMATNTCALKTEMANNTRDIIDSQKAGTDAILQFLTSEKISSLQAENASLTAQLSQNAQTNAIINTLRPVAQPAYITCSPYESIYGKNSNGGCCGGSF